MDAFQKFSLTQPFQKEVEVIIVLKTFLKNFIKESSKTNVTSKDYRKNSKKKFDISIAKAMYYVCYDLE